MSFRDFLYRVGHSYQGKVPALAARMGEKEKVLQNKLNPNMDTHHMTEDDIEQMLDFADANLDAAKFFASKADAVVISLPHGQASDTALLDDFMRVLKELGDFSEEFRRDFADGRIDAREFGRLTQASDEAIAAIIELRERIGMLVER